MASEITGASQLEIGHVLFIDIVGYSKLLTNEQRERLERLNQIVRTTEPFRAADTAGKPLRLPTGDGMILVFFTSPDAPARCAIAVSRALTGPGQQIIAAFLQPTLESEEHCGSDPRMGRFAAFP